MKKLAILVLGLILIAGLARAEDDIRDKEIGTVDKDLGSSREGSRTDDETVKREEEAINVDGLNVAQKKELRDKSEKFIFQAEVNRMMKLIINSLYRNKEIFLRELISNASDALDKIRLLSLTDDKALASNPELAIKIRADKDNKVLSIEDSGIAMTKTDLINNLGTIAKSGTAEFLSKIPESGNSQDPNDMIGQFGVGFYSGFLVADEIIVTTKHNEDKQYIWKSDSSSYTIGEDPRGDTLKRGTTVSLILKDEAADFLETDTLKNLIKKYSQFINFPIYLWTSKTIEVEADDDSEAVKSEKDAEEDAEEGEIEKEKVKDSGTTEDDGEDEDDAKVEESDEDEEKKIKTEKKKIEKTIWDWERMNEAKPLWTTKPSSITKDEYNGFYKDLTKDTQTPLARSHVVAEGEVTFKALLFIPKVQPSESFNKYGTKSENIKLFVRRVFITDDINDIMPNYLSFVRGIVDSDDLPLNVSRENLQQHKLLKVIKKKLVRKVLDALKKISKEDHPGFWKEYSTNIKLGVTEDAQNRARLSKLLHFKSSAQNMTNLSDYVARMKANQKAIYYLAGSSVDEVRKSPFVERLDKKGYEVLYLTEPVDEYAISALPLFDGKKFQNVAKEGFTLDEGEKAKERMEESKRRFTPLTKWLDETLSDGISKTILSERLTDSPCALVASLFGWTGNMERLAISNAHQKADDTQRNYYLSQKKTLEINPRHPLIKELLRRVDADPTDSTAKDIAVMMFKTATLRSGYMLRETATFAESVEQLMRKTLGIPLDETPEEDDDFDSDADTLDDKPLEDEAEELDRDDEHDEL